MTDNRTIEPVNEWLPPLRMLILAFQHVFVMYAGAVAVPLIIGGAFHLPKNQIAFLVSSDMFCCGIATLLQSIGIGRFGIRMPVIMAVSFAAVGPMIAVSANPALGIRAIYGATIAAGVIGLVLAPLVGRILRFFPPIVSGIVITAIGLNIVPVGIDWAAGGVGNPDYGSLRYLGTALAVLIFIMIVTKYAKGFLANIAVLLGISFGFIIALLLGNVSFGGIGHARWFGMILPFHFGWPVFDPVTIATMSVVMLIIFIESTGMFLALGTIVDAPVGPPRLTSGLLVDSLGTIIGGVFNSFPHSSFSQNVGLVGITGVRSRWVTAVAGGLLVLMGLIPKMSFVVASIPQFVLGGAGIVMFGMVMATGIRILAEVDYVHNRHNSYIVAISIGICLIPVVSTHFFQHMPAAAGPLLRSGIFLAAVCAVVLNLWFNGASSPPVVEARHAPLGAIGGHGDHVAFNNTGPGD
jgi:xanthine permease